MILKPLFLVFLQDLVPRSRIAVYMRTRHSFRQFRGKRDVFAFISVTSVSPLSRFKISDRSSPLQLVWRRMNRHSWRRQAACSPKDETNERLFSERHCGGLDNLMSKSPTSQKRMGSCCQWFHPMSAFKHHGRNYHVVEDITHFCQPRPQHSTLSSASSLSCRVSRRQNAESLCRGVAVIDLWWFPRRWSRSVQLWRAMDIVLGASQRFFFERSVVVKCRLIISGQEI